jgi:hypothetical protein
VGPSTLRCLTGVVRDEPLLRRGVRSSGLLLSLGVVFGEDGAVS